MKLTTTAKALALVGLTSLPLASGTSQADSGFIYFGGPQAVNPWMSYGPAFQQVRLQAALKERIAQLEQRQDAQLQRILGGMDNGKVTMREATELIREHVAISNMERRYLADGRLGHNELSDLERRLEEANCNIRFENHDREQQRGVEPREPEQRGAEQRYPDPRPMDGRGFEPPRWPMSPSGDWGRR